MASRRSGFGRYFVVITGLVLTLGGVAAAALFLTAAGEGLGAQATAMLAATIIGLGGGLYLLVASARWRGGMLEAAPTTAGRATYRSRFHRGRRA
jgi:hypothetical protein